MALAVSLEASFTSDGGFDFGATMTGLGEDLTGFDAGDITFDAGPILALIGDLAPPELSAVVAAAQLVAEQAGLELDGLSVGDDLLAPVRQLLDQIRLGQVLDLDIGLGGSTGIDALAQRVPAGLDLITDGSLAPLADLAVGAIPDLDLLDVLGQLGDTTAGLFALIKLVGALMAVETVTGKVERQAALVGGMLNGPLALAAGERVLAESGRGDVVDAIAALDVDDAIAVDAAVADVKRFALAVRQMGQEWARGMGYGEAALIGLDPAGCTALMATARAALDEAALPSVGRFATSLRGWVDPVLSLPLPDPQPGLDGVIEEALGLVVDIRAAVAAIDVTAAADQVSSTLTGALDPIGDITAALDSIATSVSSSMRQVSNVVDEIDLGPVVAGVEAALRPVTDVLDAIEAAVADVAAVIDTAAGATIAALDDIATAIGDVAGVVNGALGRLSDQLATIDFAALQGEIEGGIGQVADTLASAQLSPYFDASIDVIDTTADVIDAVPFGLLPADVQQEVVDAVEPIKQIDFTLVSTELQASLASIIGSLNTDVLDEIDAAYQEALTFLRSIDPGEAIAEFESGPFAELRAEVDAVDPAALLAPVDDQLGTVRSVLDGLDLRDEVLAPLDEVFTVVRSQLQALDPGTLLAPVSDEIDELRAEIAETIGIDRWAGTITDARDALAGAVDRLDVQAFADAFSGDVVRRLVSPLPPLSTGVASAVSGMVQSSGLAADPGAFAAVQSWFGPVDGRASVEARMTGSAEVVASTRDVVRGLDPAPIVTAAQAHHRALLAAAATLPDGSAPRARLESLLTANEPSVVLGALIENRARYLARLEVDAGVTATLAGSGLSQLTVITDGLRDQLLPIISIGEWLRILLGRFGVTDLDRPVGELFVELIDAAGPDRLLGPLVELLELLQGRAVELLDAVVDPVLDSVGDVEGVVALFDLGPISDELGLLHAEVGQAIDAVDPALLLGPTLDEVDALVDRLVAFDPLGPVRAVIDALQAAIGDLFETTTPSVVFAPAVEIHASLLALAAGLDVKGLLEPVLAALGALGLQLDLGLEETGAALARLQAALPDSVGDSAASVGASVNVGVSL